MTIKRCVAPLIPVVLFIVAAITAIWLPGVVMAQRTDPASESWRFSAEEKAMGGLDDRLRAAEQQVVGIGDWARREEPRIVELEKSADQLRSVRAVLDFIKWEATVCAAGFGGFLLWIVNWIVKSFRQLRADNVMLRREARIARNDDFQLLALPLVRLLQQDHPELANALQERIYRRQTQEDDGVESSGGIPVYRSR